MVVLPLECLLLTLKCSYLPLKADFYLQKLIFTIKKAKNSSTFTNWYSRVAEENTVSTFAPRRVQNVFQVWMSESKQVLK